MKANCLQKGDIVDIIVPASACTKEEYNAAIKFVKEFGLEPRYRTFAEVIKNGLCANSVEYRFEHLMTALNANDAKAVWCLKGGYGTQKLLEKLDETAPPLQEKIFIGFSDITILLNYFADKWGWKCVHGPMPGQIGKQAQVSWQNLADVVFGKNEVINITCQPLNMAARTPKVLQGKLMGGCLSLMQALIGTAHMPNLEGTILLLEDDRFETPRRIDRIFDHMQRAGSFYDVEAVVLGNFLEGAVAGSKDELELQEVLEGLGEYLNERGIPLLQNTRLGHGEDMLTVLIGADAVVTLGDTAKMVIKG